MKKIGYVRVSSRSQNESRQLELLKPFNLDKIVIEKESGKNFKYRPKYNDMKDFLGENDELYIVSLDRLGRNYDEVHDELENLKKKGIILRILDFKPSMENEKVTRESKLLNNMMLELLIYMAERERDEINKRQRQGIDRWIATGETKTKKAYGRPRKEVDMKKFDDVYTQWTSKKITAKRAMELLDIKPNTFYRMVHDHEGKVRDNNYEEKRKRPLLK